MGRSPKSAAPPPPHAPRGGPTPRELEAPGASRWGTPPSSRLCARLLGREPGRRGEKRRWEPLVGHQPRGQWSAETRHAHAHGHSLRDWKRGASAARARQGAARQEAIAHAPGSPCALGAAWPGTQDWGQTQCWFAPRGVVREVTSVFDSRF